MMPATPGPPRAVLERWSTAEQRLAMIAMADPDGYIRHLDALGSLVDSLVRFVDVTELVEAYVQWDAVVASTLPDAVAGELDVASLAGAAWMVRFRQLSAARREREVEQRIAEARRSGQMWVTIWATGPEPPATVFEPYERTVMRTRDGVAVRASIDIDPDTYQPAYTAEVVRLDPRNGSLVSSSPDRQEAFPDRPAWEHGIAALQAELDR